MNKELEAVKKESFDRLIRMGYGPELAKEIVDSFKKVSGYFNGKPSRVTTTTGIELFLN